ncbi:arsenic resistance N-acetyltransferase ArsN2 [Balneolaceae bacterium ANBcel3]|nr:arsenic resistance N-acetyltransferase ArsN2 [Balneolaceae bacterium ANBcel3]
MILSDIEYKKATSGDIPMVQKLLMANRLPYQDVVTSGVSFIIALSDGHIIGCIGIEGKDNHALLRSFAVDERYKNKGIGSKLYQRLLAQLSEEKTEMLHLLTTTADGYFKKKGFVRCDRTTAPESIKSTKEFSSICPSDSIYMTLCIKPISPGNSSA